ncbi:hypothetical protein BK816_08245 [Boudabousia tangfeifanii]|uniref:Phosphatidic acid phosphatase type 2/haloperoxidase domain-containing protein n=1 Tax=Boudabousia tangfeifanii TaxID=1912795 RepID=A0A1D9MLL6_9ACTO|nr:phosphatase PAP2 family protein [Boudabousia tangfeifanii]AOZ73271.1 hypothetical protein BK816_08245 [Boudabousia tangfeifanii]
MPQIRTSRPDRANWRRYLVRFSKALAGFLGTWLLWYAAVTTKLGQAVDEFSMDSATHLKDDFRGFDESVLWLVSGWTIGVIGVFVAVVALWRRRWLLGVRAGLEIGLTIGSVQLLKHFIFYRPALSITYALKNSLPSGHTAAAAAVAVALVMVVNRSWRSTAALVGTLWVSLVGIATVVNGWHRLADVLAAIMIAGAWGMLLSPLEDTDANRRSNFDQKLQMVLGWVGWILALVGLLAMSYVLWEINSFLPLAGDKNLVHAIEYLAQGCNHARFVAQIGIAASVGGLTTLVLRAIDKLVR